VARHRGSNDQKGNLVTTGQLTNAFYIQSPKLQNMRIELWQHLPSCVATPMRSKM